jgi:hypothetical protein
MISFPSLLHLSSFLDTHGYIFVDIEQLGDILPSLLPTNLCELTQGDMAILITELFPGIRNKPPNINILFSQKYEGKMGGETTLI